MSLHITLGSMYAGKTTKLIDEYTIAQDINKSPIIIDFDCNSNPKYDVFSDISKSKKEKLKRRN